MIRLVLVLLMILACALKLAGAVPWSWAIVLAPSWVPMAFLAVIVVVTFIVPEER
jgi:hypothetical protein